MEKNMAVAVIGLGEMGSALAEAFLSVGHSVTVWNRTASKGERFVMIGAHLAANVEDAAAAADVIVVNLQGGPAVVETLEAAGAALSGRTVVDLTDGPSEDVERSAMVAAKYGADYLHGQIMTIAPAIGSVDAVIFYGGPAEVFDRHEPLLRVLGGRSMHVAVDPTVPVLYGMAVHDVMWGLLNGFLHAAAILRSANIPIAQFQRDAAPSLSALPSMFATLADEIDQEQFAAPFGALKHHMPSIDDVIAEGQRRGVDNDLPSYAKALVTEAIASGHGDDSYAVLVNRFSSAQGPTTVTTHHVRRGQTTAAF